MTGSSDSAALSRPAVSSTRASLTIGVLGNYDASSIGDYAILEGITGSLATGSVHVLVFSLDVAASRRFLPTRDGVVFTAAVPRTPPRARFCAALLPPRLRRLTFLLDLVALKRDVDLLRHISFWREKRVQIKELDLLVIGGGNLIQDIWPTSAVRLLAYALLARRLGVPVMLLGVGAGPIQSVKGKICFGVVVRLARFCTTRDTESLRIIRRLGARDDRCRSLADPAVLISSPTTSAAVGPRKDVDRLPIGINVLPYYDERYWPSARPVTYRRYVVDMARIVSEVATRTSREVVLFPTNGNDINAIKDILERLGSQTGIGAITSTPTTHELLVLLRGFDAVLGTRLHSVVLALVAGTPFMAFSYHPKVSRFCAQIGFADNVVDFDPHGAIIPAAEQIVDRLSAVLASGPATRERMRIELAGMRALAEIGPKIAVATAYRRRRRRERQVEQELAGWRK